MSTIVLVYLEDRKVFFVRTNQKVRYRFSLRDITGKMADAFVIFKNMYIYM